MPEPYRQALTAAGLKHPRVREFLAVKRHPASHGLPSTMALEGTWMIQHALITGVRLRAVFVCTALLRGAEGQGLVMKAIELGAEGYEVSERVLSRLTSRDGPDGIAALGQARTRALDDIRITRRTRVMIADGWDLPGNLGTLIRCADGAGASAVLVVEQGFGLGHPLVLKASMGAALAMPVVAVGRPAARRWLRERGFRVVAADPAGSRSYRDIDYRGPLAIVVGSERRGLDREWLADADSIAAIPMLGISDSLNAAIAGALLLYEALAQDSRDPGLRQRKTCRAPYEGNSPAPGYTGRNRDRGRTRHAGLPDAGRDQREDGTAPAAAAGRRGRWISWQGRCMRSRRIWNPSSAKGWLIRR